MTIKTGKKLGFFAALTMMIGSIVGIGIFFKSGGILSSNNWNGVGTLVSWILGGLLSLGAAMSFSEIGSIKTNNVNGLPAYAEKFIGKKFGYFVRSNFTLFYFSIFALVLSFFTTETIIAVITMTFNKTAADVPFYGHIIITTGLLAALLVVNKISVHASGWIARVTTILKWLPLLAVAILGITMAGINKNMNIDGSKLYGQNAFTNGQSFTFTGMLSALPAVLFAYDAFLGTLTLKDKIKGGEKRLPWVVAISIISSATLYSFIAIAAILHGSGWVSGQPFGLDPSAGRGIFDQLFNNHTAIIIGKIIIVFIMISAFGVTNSFIAIFLANVEQAVISKTIFGMKTLSKKWGESRTVLFYLFVIYIFWALIIFIPALVTNSDIFIDGASNFPTTFFFAIYAIVILGYTLKRKKFDNRKMNNIAYQFFAWMSIIGIFFVVAYQVTYGFFIDAILHPDETIGWGLLLNNDHVATKAQSAILMFSYLGLFFGLPFLNQFLTRKLENNEVIVDTQKKIISVNKKKIIVKGIVPIKK